MNSILLIGDIVGYGNLGMSVMLPILSNMKYEIYRLPSSLVSNNFGYGKFAVLDTTEYMCQCIDVWEEQGFTVDAVCTGFLVSKEQAQLVTDYCRRLRARGTRIFVDPIMADDGRLYNGLTDKTVEYMREICKVADVIVPNVTEAQFLTGLFLGKESLTMDEAETLVTSLHKLTGNSVVVSSMVLDGQTCTMLYDHFAKRMKVLPYQQLKSQFSGTGDVFSSITFGRYIQGYDLETSVQNAMDFVSKVIRENVSYGRPDNGIPIELHLSEL